MNRKSQGAGYTLPKQKLNTLVALSVSPLGPDYGPVMMGRVIDHTGRRVTIQWEEGEPEVWNGDDLQYKLDRGLLVLTPPPKPRRVRVPKDKLKCKQCGELRKDCDCPRKSAQKPEEWGIDRNHPDRPVGSHDLPLTGVGDSDTMPLSTEGDALTPEEKEQDMATEEKLSAKEAARELGTDARTLRKFFRSGKSPIDPVGQGGRYGISKKDMKKVKKAFTAWSAGSKKKTDAPDEIADDVEEFIETVNDALDEAEADDVVEVDLDDLEGPDDIDLLDIELDLDEEA